MMDRPKRILIVDDDPKILGLLSDMVTSLQHQVETAQDGFEAMAKVGLDIDLILLDVNMPGMDGFEVARSIRKQYLPNELPIIMVTGMATREDRIGAVNAGANDFVAKPFDLTEIHVRMKSLLGMKAAHDALRRHKDQLEEIVRRRTQALRTALDDVVEAQRRLRAANLETIQRLMAAAEYKDMGSAAHIQRMSEFSALIARKLRLSPQRIELIYHASAMHDIGKIGMPQEILLKPGKLNRREWRDIKRHPTIGAKILQNSTSQLLRLGEIIALTHHEKWDGSGYPKGLRGDEIPVEGRISAIADVFDALTSKRPYKEAFSNDTAFQILWNGRGKHFDPELVDLFLSCSDEIVGIQSAFLSKETTQETTPKGFSLAQSTY
jgi:putative two-component system response regulator